MLRWITLLIALFIGAYCNAQHEEAHKIVDTFASPYMAGRGYVDNGNKKAAKYLKNVYKSLGLVPFGKSYLQEFSYPINTYPQQCAVSFTEWVPNPGCRSNPLTCINSAGIFYIIMPTSPTLKGLFPVVRFDRAVLRDSNKLKGFFTHDYSKSFVLVDDSGATDKKEKEIWASLQSNPFKAKGLIILVDKLTEETSERVEDFAVINALRSSDFKNALTISVDIKNKFIEKYPTQNLIGYIKGKISPDTFIVFTAHYDHLGKMGDIYFPGANDNASGVAMLLMLAKYYSQHQSNLRYSIAFMAFSGEEVGLLGSKYYTEHPLFPLSNIKFLINMDIMGTGDEGITVVNGTIYDKAFKDLKGINDSLHLLKLIKPRGETSNSDHYFFYKNHVPSFFIYTMGGIKAYHDIYDRRETLPLTKFNEVLKLLEVFTQELNN